MKMRKLLTALLLIAVLLSACTEATTEAPAATNVPAATDAPAPTDVPAATEPPAPTDIPAEPVEIRFTYYADGVEADVIKPLIDQFMVENPGITVILDVVPYKTIDEQLPVQVDSGEGPDMARITNFGA